MKPILVAWVFALFHVLHTPALAQDAVRLSDNVVPLHYRLDLTIVPDSPDFSGLVEIDVELTEPSDTIVLHGDGLIVKKVEVLDAEGTSNSAVYNESPDNGTSKVKMAKAIGPGKITLKLTYGSKIRRSGHGLYRSNHDGRVYAYTQMQAIYARRVFPSFDEPRFKTPFDISITHRADHVAVSNGPQISQTKLDDGMVQTRFATTQPLPTYLTAMAVGEFDVVEAEALPPTAVRKRAIPLRGIAPKGEGQKLSHILKITPSMFEILENWFQVPYPYAKLDLIAAHKFRSWGMENAGAIIYRAEKILLEDPPSVYGQRSLAGLHAHELAHSWFGNYVTPVWWDDIWLNESFATWMADKVLHLWQPEQYAAQRSMRGGAYAMWNDRLASARAIRQPIKTDGDIVNAFDSATYSKGGGVITMIENFLGEEEFRLAVQQHIRNHPHGVASTKDFLTALAEKAADPRLEAAVQTFLAQPGVPLVRANLVCEAGSPPVVDLKQSRFLPLGSRGIAARSWKIPLCLRYGSADGEEKQSCHLFTQAQQRVSLAEQACPRWFVPNKRGAAYLVFDLDERGWDNLVANFGKLSVAEQISTAASVNAAYLAGRIDTKRLIQFARLFGKASEWDVARAPMRMLRTLKYRTAPDALRSRVDKISQEVFADQRQQFKSDIASFGSVDPDPRKAKQRSDLFWFLALDAGDEDLRKTLAEAGRAYVGYKTLRGMVFGMDYDQLHPNFVWLGLISAMKEEGLPFAEHLINLLGKGHNRSLHNSFLAALGHSIDPEVVARVRQYMLARGTPASDVSSLLNRQSGHADNAEGATDWLMEHYDRLLEILPKSDHPWLVWRTSSTCREETRDKVEAFFKPRITKLTGAKRAMANVLENISLCAALRENQMQGAEAALTR